MVKVGTLVLFLTLDALEKEMDRGAWWATVYGVAQSWTRLK